MAAHQRAADNEVWVTALDVGQGSALLIETKEHAWLYDAGPRYSADTDAGERLILPYLRHRGIGSLDGLIVSHLDNDHSGGAASILRAVPVRSRRVFDRHRPSGAQRARRRRAMCGRHAMEHGTLTFAVLHPTRADYEAKRPTNSMSCVVLITSGATRLLLTGDVPLADEIAMLTREPELRADWLAVPHHGSRSSSSALLLDTLGATVRCGAGGLPQSFSTSRRGGHRSLSGNERFSFFEPITRARCNGASQPMGRCTVASSRQTQRALLAQPAADRRRSPWPRKRTPEPGAAAPDAIPGPPEPFAGR